MKNIKIWKRRGRQQKLVRAIQNNVLVSTMFNLHKGKISDKFLIRCIDILCKENKDLFNRLVKAQELRCDPYIIVTGRNK